MAATLLSSSLRHSVLPELRRRIIEGDYRLGEQLSENALAIEFGMSRTPVREALMTLQAEGLVEVRPQRGTYVFSLEGNATREICDLRGILEAGALALAARRDGAGLARRLGSLVDEAAAAWKRRRLRDCERLDLAFHECLIEASDNGLLIDSYRRIAGQVNALRFRLPAPAGRIEAALRQHRQIAGLVARDDIPAARRALGDHVDNVYRLLSTPAPKD
jgi:DNA-binding GntR family transcriptional regulator